MRRPLGAFALAVALLLTSNAIARAQSEALHVPADFATIQEALSAASVDALILVAPGTCTGATNKNLDFLGKNMTLRAEGGASVTTIDCQGSGRAFWIHRSEGPTARIEGFTMVNGGDANARGGGILVDGASPTLTDCVIRHNTAQTGGGVLVQYFASPTFERCRIVDNVGWEGGGVTGFYARSPVLVDCEIAGNAANVGGGVLSLYGSTIKLEGCSVAGNRAETGGGIHVLQALANAERTIVYGNCASNGSQVKVASAQTLTFDCCIVDSSGVDGPGQVTYSESSFENPGFCYAAPCAMAPTTAGNYGLRLDSPGLPENSECNARVGAPAQDCAMTDVAWNAPAFGSIEVHASPNPFATRTRIAYRLPAAGAVRITIHDARGRRLATMEQGQRPAGEHATEWNGRDAAGTLVGPGLYFVRVESNVGASAIKLIVAR